MTSKGESERRGLPARVGWVIGPSGEAGSLVRRDGERTACFASFHGRAWYVHADPYTSSVVLCGCDVDEDGARAAAEAALWARDGFGVGRVYGARLAMGAREALSYVATRRPVALPGLGVSGLWVLTSAREVDGLTEIDAVRVPFDTQAEADVAPLTHALDAEGNALCPYDPARLAYVSPRADRVTCPVCVEKVQATAEPAPLPWNWCPTCKQHVDIDADTHEGERTRCLGCRVWYVVCRDGDGSGKWWLESREEHDAENAEPALLPTDSRCDAVRAPVVEAGPAETRQVWGWCNVYPEEHVDGDHHPLDPHPANGEPAPREPVSYPADPEASVRRDEARNVRAFPLRRVEPSAPALDATAEIVTDPDLLALGCAALCGEEEPDALIATGAGSAPLCVRCYTRAVREDERRRMAKAEPSASTDGDELARLLPGLPATLAALLDAHRGEEGEADIGDLFQAYKLLLAERDRVSAALQALFSDVATPTELATHTVELLEESARETDALRARVAELEARAPAGYRVAALLADLKRMREEGDGDMREAIEAVREHLGTPTPLDRAVAEVCAEHKRIAGLGPWDPMDHWAAICTEADSIKVGVAPGRDRLIRVGVEALAGMLACDASATKEPG